MKEKDEIEGIISFFLRDGIDTHNTVFVYNLMYED